MICNFRLYIHLRMEHINNQIFYALEFPMVKKNLASFGDEISRYQNNIDQQMHSDQEVVRNTFKVIF